MKRLPIAVLVSLLLGVSLLSKPVWAAGASLSLSPPTASIGQGDIVSLDIYEDSGSEPVNAVQANLAYPKDLLNFVSISSSNGFGFNAQSVGGNGAVKIARGAVPPVSGNQMVATVRFKALTGFGSASINIADGSNIVSSNSNKNIMTDSSGATITLQGGSSQNDKQAPKISNIKVSGISLNMATVTWTTSEPSTSEVVYGPGDHSISTSDAATVTDHRLVLSSPLIRPGVTYDYIVKSTDPAGNTAASAAAKFTTVGLKLSVTVTDPKGQPVSGAKVTIGNSSAKTNQTGQALLQGLSTSKQTGTITYHGKTTKITADVLDKTEPNTPPQKVSYKIAATGSNIVPLAVGLLILAGVLYISLNKTARPRRPKAK